MDQCVYAVLSLEDNNRLVCLSKTSMEGRMPHLRLVMDQINSTFQVVPAVLQDGELVASRQTFKHPIPLHFMNLQGHT